MNLNGTSANRLSLPAPPSRRSGALARREGGRNEWGESRREGPPSKRKTSSPRPSPPSFVGRRGRGRRRPVQEFNARILIRWIITPALSRWEKASVRENRRLFNPLSVLQSRSRRCL